MAEGDGAIYNGFKYRLLNGVFNLDTGNDAMKMILVTGHSPDIDTHDGYADVSGDEESGTGYSAGGETLVNQATTEDTGNDRGVLDADDVTWSSLDVGTPSHGILYDDTPTTPQADPLIAYWEVTTASNGGDYTLQFSTSPSAILYLGT
jgi:hypothetical protein